MQTKLFVRNLSWDTTESHLRDLFSPCGEVVAAQVVTDQSTGSGRGFAFVEMKTQVAAESAIRKLDMRELNGRQISVRFADMNIRKARGRNTHR